VVLVEPEHRAAQKETTDFIASVIEDVRLPVGMKALSGVGMFEQVCTVEVGQTVSIGREVRRHPIQDHADAVLMQVVHQKHEILWRAVAGGRGKVAGGLVSPGAIKRVLHDG